MAPVQCSGSATGVFGHGDFTTLDLIAASANALNGGCWPESGFIGIGQFLGVLSGQPEFDASLQVCGIKVIEVVANDRDWLHPFPKSDQSAHDQLTDQRTGRVDLVEFTCEPTRLGG